MENRNEKNKKRRKEDHWAWRCLRSVGSTSLVLAAMCFTVFLIIAVGEKPGVPMVWFAGLAFAVETIWPWFWASAGLVAFGFGCRWATKRGLKK